MSSKLLFNDKFFSDYKRERKEEMKEEISKLSQEELKNSTDSMSIIFSRKYGHSTLQTHDIIKEDGGEVEKEIRHDPSRGVFKGDRPATKKAHRIKVKIPYEGAEKLLKVQPSTFDYNPPRYDELKENQIVFYVDFFEDSEDAEDIKEEIDRWKSKIEKYIGNLNEDIREMSETLRNEAEKVVESRRETLETKSEIFEELEVVEEKSESVGYVEPKKKHDIELTSSEEEGHVALSDSAFEEILGIIDDMGLNIERLSSPVRNLGEEPLRDILVSTLNTHFEGLVTAESYNRGGRTDILLRYQNKNIFIAECKNWDGVSKYKNAIDQLLDNLTPHDKNSAVIIFSRRKNFEEVKEKIEDSTPEHENCVTKITGLDPYDVYKFKHPSGSAVNIAVKSFDVSI